MSHTSSNRRGPPIECPLASLGRNTPSLENQYHHPLSSSSSDTIHSNTNNNNQQDLRYNPINNSIIRQEISSLEHHSNFMKMTRKSPQLNSTSDNQLPSYVTPKQQQQQQFGGKIHPQSESQPTNRILTDYSQNNRHFIYDEQTHPPLPPHLLIQQQRISYTPIDSILQYHQEQHDRLSPVIESTPNVYLLENLHNNSSNSVLVNHQDDMKSYFLEKMDRLYIQGAIRNNSNDSNNNNSNNLINNSNNNNNSNSENDNTTERYYLEDNMDNICSYSSSTRNDMSPNFLRRTSSPSETSGSDRYLLDRARISPAVLSNSSRGFISNNTNNNIINNRSNNHSNNQDSSRIQQSQITQNFITEGLPRFGRFSPNLDQGYHTLASPSPSGQQISVPWSKKVVCRSGPVFDRLTDDVILKIFEWLDSCNLCKITRVCRRFETLVWKPILWKNIVLKGEHIVGDKALKTIFRRLCGQTRNGVCPYVEKVMLTDGCRLSDKGLQLLARRCPELTHLQIQYSFNVTNTGQMDVVTKCTNLQHLDITGCTQITSINFNPGFDPPRRLLLQYLDLTDCCSINDDGLEIIVRNCPQLVYLYLRRCIQITDSGLKFVPSFCIALRELSISDCTGVTDFGLHELATLGATLRYLSVAKCDQVSDAGLKVIARRCYKLRYLNARGCEAVSDDSIIVLARSCPRLRALDIGKCDVSDAGLRALAESCPNLKKLSLRNCDMITDRGVQCIAYYCRGLQQLNIQDCQISIEGYRAVKKFCKRCIIEHTNPGFC